jgi:curved DNA-binding protein CbpA
MSFPIEQGLFQYNIRDHHAILGVPLDADEQEIRKQYLKIARYLHPDTCKFATDREKKLANRLFSHLVSPANKQISTLQLRMEHLLIVAQIAQKITQESTIPAITSENAKKLLNTDSPNFHLQYRRLINKISETQYAKVDEAISDIGLISEINLVYIIQKQRQDFNWADKNLTASAKSGNPYIKRAQQYIEQNLPAQAITELRDVLEHEPSNAIAHALIGLAYLEQNQITMAKIHINKSLQLGSHEALVLKAKEALDKITRESDNSKEQSGRKTNDIFKNIFGGKKE